MCKQSLKQETSLIELPVLVPPVFDSLSVVEWSLSYRRSTHGGYPIGSHPIGDYLVGDCRMGDQPEGGYPSCHRIIEVQAGARSMVY
jgi:hypothetical protein